MPRIFCAVEVGLVTAIAIGGEGSVIAVHVALSARGRHMRAGQRESRLRVVERRWTPGGGCVTHRAIGRENRSNVIGIDRLSEVRLVALVTIGRRMYILIVHVAMDAGQGGVHSSKRISGVGDVIEFSIQPIRSRVAHATIMRQARRNVRRIGRPGEIWLVARVAIRRRALEPVADVTGLAFERGVHAGQCIAGDRQVIELGPEPVIHRVARLAGGGKTRVIDGCIPGVLRVAGIAGGGKAREPAHCRALVAPGAIHHGVRAHQREPVLMVLNIARGNLPALHRVATVAIGAELAPMEVCMAVGTMGADVLEHHRCVAFRAADFLVHAAQRIGRLVVTELRQRADRLPTRIRVAVLAGADAWPMGIGDLGARTLAGFGGLPRSGIRLLRFSIRRLRRGVHGCAHKGQRQHGHQGQFASYPRVPEEELPWSWLTKPAHEKHRRILFQTPNSLAAL